MKRYFEFVDGKSSKFWEVWVEGSTVYTRFGKIGVNGQTTVKDFPSSEAAETGRDKSIAEKLRKGYVEGAVADSEVAESVVVKVEETMTPGTSDDLAKLAKTVISTWSRVSETGEDLAELVTEETFLGIQYSRLHVEGVVRLTPESREVLEKAHETLVGILSERP